MRIFRIVSVDFADIAYRGIEEHISNAIRHRRKTTIAYATAHIVNLAKEDETFCKALAETDIVHPEGNGVWLASKILYEDGFSERFNWTDHAELLLRKCASEQWTIFFLGSTTEHLHMATERIRNKIPNLKIVGMKNGFDDIESGDLIDSINAVHPDILWVAMGSPKQNLWMQLHRHELNCYVIQAIGDAITLLAGVKRRGPKYLQFLGLEWFVRLFFNPIKLFSRYVVGNPVFIARVINQKLQSINNTSSRT